MTRGHVVEREVAAKVEGALQPPYAVYANVHWTGPDRPGGPAGDGEADLVIAHPDHGILVVEVKDGVPTRSGTNRWFLGPIQLKESPFQQAESNKYDLANRFAALPEWPSGRRPAAGHAVAFPSVDLASLPRGHVLLGPDVDRAIVLDAAALETPEAIRTWTEAAFRFWRGKHEGPSALDPDGMALLDRFLAPRYTLRRLVRGRIADDRDELIAASRSQVRVLTQHRRSRRLEVIGPAGSGKSMLAAEKARALAAAGYRTLLVCFNQALATALGRDLAEAPAPGGLTVSTFHRLCELTAREAGTLPARPEPIPAEWWNRTLPDALGAAIDARPSERFHAVIVDEGQDFDADWLVLLQSLLQDPDNDVLWIFHDPGQALVRPDVVRQLGLPLVELFENFRNPGPIARLAARFYRGGDAVADLRDDEPEEVDGDRGRVVLVEAHDDRAMVDAVRRQLHRLVSEEQVRAWDIAVLSGRSAVNSAVWEARRFGNLALQNPAIRDDGSSLGLPPEEVPEEVAEGSLVSFETIRRFKGLERPVVILCEIPTSGDRLEELLYTGMTRATTELVVVAEAGLVERMR